MFRKNFSQYQNAWFSRMRSEWLAVANPLDGFAISDSFPSITLPSSQQLKSASLHSSRYNMICEVIPQGVKCCEVGVQEGYFSKFLLDAIKPTMLYLIDIDISPIRSANPDLLANSCVTIIEGDSVECITTLKESLDFIYIDADHSYEGCKKDAEAATLKLKVGGHIVFNDYTLWSPIEFYDYGVPYVVGEILSSGKYEVSAFSLHPFLYNDIALKKVSN